MNETSASDLWSLVLLNSLFFIAVAFRFARPCTTRDWRSFGAYSAFIVALFTEALFLPVLLFMYTRLAHREEFDSLADFGDDYRDYMARTPAFIPRRERSLPSTRRD